MFKRVQNSSAQLSFRRDLITTALVPLLAMALFLLITFLQLNNRLAANQSVDNDDQTIAQAQKVQTLLVDMETGVRGRLLTGDSTFLQPYQAAEPVIDSELVMLNQLIAGNSAQQDRVSAVQSQLGDWRQFATAALASTSPSPVAAEQLRGKALMDQMRQSISDFIDAQKSLRATHVQDAAQISQSTIAIRSIVAVLLAAFLAFFFRNRFGNLSNRFGAALRTAEQKTDEAVNQQDWLKGTLSSIGDGVIATDNRGNVTLINRIAQYLTETKAEDVVGQPLAAIFSAYDEQTRAPIVTTSLSGAALALESTPRSSEINQVLLIGKGGRETPIENSLSPIRDARGLTLGTVYVFRDLTERRRAGTQLISSEQRYRDVTNAMPMMLWTATPSGEMDYHNQRWFDYTGLTSEQSKSAQDWQVALHPDDAEAALTQWQHALQTGESYEIEARWKRAADGEYLWHLGRSVPICDPAGKPSTWVGTLTNIDKQKQNEVTLEVSAQRLEERNQELDQFAYITSHDLKAPLRGIANLSQWIEEDLGENANEEIHKQMELLRGRVHRMEGLIDGILLYSRVGRVKETIENVDVNVLLSDLVDFIAPPADMTITIQPAMPVLRTERVPLQQVFANLIGNAIKHRPATAGHITVGVEDRKKFYEFSVADDGPGIPQEFFQKIFVIFQTLESRDKVEGSGLGLALVKKIVEQQGGKIWLDSQVGVGTTFYFTWPKFIRER